MDVQDLRPIAQWIRTVVLKDNCALGQQQAQPYVHHIWLKPWANSIGIQAPNLTGNLPVKKSGGRRPSTECWISRCQDIDVRVRVEIDPERDE
eukprot:5758217-Prorocentrum_lima.AAC.1